MAHDQHSAFGIWPLRHFKQLRHTGLDGEFWFDLVFAAQRHGGLLSPKRRADQHLGAIGQMPVQPAGHFCSLFFALRGQGTGWIVATINPFLGLCVAP